MQPCDVPGNPATLVVTGGEPAPGDHPARPRAAGVVAAFTGATVEVALEGFRAGEQAQVFSTDERYDGLRYRADPDGTVRFPVDARSDAGLKEDYFVAVQASGGGADPVFSSFMIVTLHWEGVTSPYSDVFAEAVRSVGIPFP